MSELEKFLRQAAQRRAQKSRPSSRPPSPPPVLDEVEVELEEETETRRLMESPAITPHSISQVSPHIRPEHLAVDIDQADERMQAHVQQALVHEVGHLSPKGRPPKGKKKGQGKDESKETPAESMSNQETSVSRGPSNIAANQVSAYLSNPQSLRALFIASEIFKRKF